LRGILLAIGSLLASGISQASESDPWTYAHIPLADSSALVSERLTISIQASIDAVNTATHIDHQSASDTELEFAFFSQFRSMHVRDLAWGMFERCIGTNSCAGWPSIERIQMHPEESVFYAANWRFIPARFHLASIVNVCGVRMGADKLTHFFDDGFHYFNGLRSKRKNLDPEDIRRLSMAFEQSYMGTRITGIVSRADIEANLAGVQFYSDFFGGGSPLIGRAPGGGLTMLRYPDVCDYVTDQYDERVLANEFAFSLLNTARARQRAADLENIIAERGQLSARLARELGADELALQKNRLLARRIPMTRWQNDFPKGRMLGHATGMVTQWLFDTDFRQVSNLFGFDPLKPGKLDDRKPIKMRSVELAIR
jgi:hypothetical protein